VTRTEQNKTQTRSRSETQLAAFRSDEPGVWFVRHRGRAGCSIFLTTREYETYLSDLVMVCRQSGVQIHAWCLIRNEIQLLLGNVSRASLRRLMTRLAARHVFRQCTGDELPDFVFEPALQTRRLVRSRDILDVASEIDLLPVRKTLVAAPAAYLWSSYIERSTGSGRAPRTAAALWRRLSTSHGLQPITVPEAAYLDLACGQNGRREAYRRLVADRISQQQQRILDQITDSVSLN